MHTKLHFDFNIKKYDSLPSTNKLARQHAIDGDPEGLVIVADFQTDGQGQHGRTWESPKGKNLLFSILIRPTIAPNKIALLTTKTCEIVAQVLKSHYEIDCELKMPNDVLVQGKKICGVLVETVSESSQKMDSAVVGIGLNVNAIESELLDTAISMKMVKSQDFDRREVLEKILAEFKNHISEFYT